MSRLGEINLHLTIRLNDDEGRQRVLHLFITFRPREPFPGNVSGTNVTRAAFAVRQITMYNRSGARRDALDVEVIVDVADRSGRRRPREPDPRENAPYVRRRMNLANARPGFEHSDAYLQARRNGAPMALESPYAGNNSRAPRQQQDSGDDRRRASRGFPPVAQ